eukprot:TRINITY_DN8186_c0_g1_i2.p1 TRINITY_DN8186_c0_g1~~TRINITY_DN8186_c0_g1_i2.p1  ORF type:complete len:233 (-),score=27.53 TRINITY_DN8186_c0_g1_i2:54-752(-)
MMKLLFCLLSLFCCISLALVPAQILDLQNWKLQLPFEKNGGILEVKQPELATYSLPNYFYVEDNAVVFAAWVNGTHTSGSEYPRTELREMNGTQEASWSTAKGTHTMTLKQAYTHLPEKRPEVVGAQIHESSSDVNLVQVRLNHPNIVIYSPDGKVTLEPNYVLGTIFALEIQTANGLLKISYNGQLRYSKPYSASRMYFKAGAYVQSNLNYDDASQYGQTKIYSLNVVHTD